MLLIILLVGCAYKPELNIPYENNVEIKVMFDEDLIKVIQILNDSKELKCAFYDIDEELLKILRDKKAELIIEKENYNNYGIKDKNKYSMHNKFCIIDEKAIITGSMNPTDNGFYKNDNNMIYVESKSLAKNYLDEFNEMKSGNYGLGKRVKNPVFKINNETWENYFCPDDDCKGKILDKLNMAKKSIYFMAFSFTDKEIAEILVKKGKTLDVQGVLERKRINMNYNQYDYLKNHIKVYPDNNPNTMHHKVFIIDEEIVIMGSMNPTESGNQRNDENILIIQNKEIAHEFHQEFERIPK